MKKTVSNLQWRSSINRLCLKTDWKRTFYSLHGDGNRPAEMDAKACLVFERLSDFKKVTFKVKVTSVWQC